LGLLRGSGEDALNRSIEVSVRLYGILRDMAGQAEERLAVDAGITLRALVTGPLAERHPEMRPALLTADGAMSPHLVCFHNTNLLTAQSTDVVLNDGDEIRVFPAISGG
jgi:molybdopterin converting factor small subunit